MAQEENTGAEGKKEDALGKTEFIDPQVVSRTRYEFLVRINGEQLLPLDDEDALIQLPNYVAVKALLKALRYILETPEGESVLARAVTVMRRYRQYLPQFANDVKRDAIVHSTLDKLSGE